MRFAYPVEIEAAADGVTVTCPDVPEMVTSGDTREEAIGHAADALVSALSFYVEEDKAIPRPLGRAWTHRHLSVCAGGGKIGAP
jgi:antitoxin HicB